MFRQPGDLGVLRTNVAEEARTRGFASQIFDWFAFIALQIFRL
jgi:hypothetical protein